MTPVKLPGQILAGARYRDDLTQVELAGLTGLTLYQVLGLGNGHIPIDLANSEKLAGALHINSQHFLTP